MTTFVRMLFLGAICLTLASCGVGQELPGIHAGEGKNSIQFDGGGFWVESHIGDLGNKQPVIFRTLIVWPKIEGFGNSHSLSSRDDAQIIKVSKNADGEMYEVISYQVALATLTIDGKKYKAALGDYFLIDLTGFPVVKVLQKSSPKIDENTDANILLTNFQTIFPSQKSIQNLSLPTRK